MKASARPVSVARRRRAMEKTMRYAKAYTRHAVSVLALGQVRPGVREAVEDALDAIMAVDEGAPLWELGHGVLDVLAAERLVRPRPPMTRQQAATCGRAALRLSHRHETVET